MCGPTSSLSGKTLGGGLPIGAVCGRRHFMRRFREDRPADICFARGTFTSHPYVMAAMNEFLRRLEEPEICALYRDLDQTWDRRAAALNRRLRDARLPVQVTSLSSIWTICYTPPFVLTTGCSSTICGRKVWL